MGGQIYLTRGRRTSQESSHNEGVVQMGERKDKSYVLAYFDADPIRPLK